MLVYSSCPNFHTHWIIIRFTIISASISYLKSKSRVVVWFSIISSSISNFNESGFVVWFSVVSTSIHQVCSLANNGKVQDQTSKSDNLHCYLTLKFNNGQKVFPH